MVYFLVAIFIFGVIFVMGPRLDLDVEISDVKLPDNLDLYLTQQESLFSDIKLNTEKRIVWADPNNKKPSKTSLVFVHGFSASRQEVSPLLENLAKQMSANVYFTRLQGHGRSNDAMAEVSLSGMLIDTVEALGIGRRIGEKVILVGNSTGATLITWLVASQNIDAVSGIVLLSPNYGLKHPKSRLLVLPWAKYFIPFFEGPTYRFKPDGESQRRYWTYEYPINALFPMMALISLTNDTNIEKINVPLLMMYSENDGVVDVGKIKAVYRRFGSQQKQMISVENAEGRQSHVLAGDALSPGTTGFVAEQITEFIDAL